MGIILLAFLFALTFEFNNCKLCTDLVGIIQEEMKVSNNTINIIEDKGIKQICQNILDGKIEYWMSELIDSVQRYQIPKHYICQANKYYQDKNP